jgi:hypothetical protein
MIEPRSPQLLAGVLEVIKETAAERGWSIDVTHSTTNNPARVYVAHVRGQDGSAIGMGMSESGAMAVCEAWRSAYQTALA